MTEVSQTKPPKLAPKHQPKFAKAHPTKLARRFDGERQLQKLTTILVTLLLLGLPFHAFFVTWLGYLSGQSWLLSIWKEALVGGLTVMALYASSQRPGGWRWLKRPPVISLGLAISFGLIGLWIARRFDISTLAGIKTTVIPFILFFAMQPLASHLRWSRLRLWVLGPATIVAILAILQFLIMPTQWLTSLGYGSTTIAAFQAIRPEVSFGRSFATLGGPNQLGAYLILPTIWFLGLALTAATRQKRLIAAIAWSILTLGLVVSFSRSAWVGLLIAAGVLIWRRLPGRWRIPSLATFVGLGGLGYVFLENIIKRPITTTDIILKNIFVRADIGSGTVVGADEGHIQAVQNGLRLVSQHPFGLGIGAAGPASTYVAGGIITENWYLQILLELGWVGAVAVLVAWGECLRRWWQAKELHHHVLMASLVGLAGASFFLHIWADSTLALMWWVLAGISYAQISEKREANR